jgi:serine/threonine protein kinase
MCEEVVFLDPSDGREHPFAALFEFETLLANSPASTVFLLRARSAPPPRVALKRVVLDPRTDPHHLPREGAIWQRLGPHPNVVALRRVLFTPHVAWFEMDYWGGGDAFKFLRDARRNNRRATVQVVRRMASDVLRALAHLHALGVAHANVKLSNLFLAADKCLFALGDFSHSLFAPSALQPPPPSGANPPPITPEEALGAGSLYGSPACMPPEYFEDRGGVFLEGDLWGLGLACVLLRATGAQREEGGLNNKIVALAPSAELKALRDSVIPELFAADVALMGCVRKMMAITPAERSSAAALMQELEGGV